MDVAETSSISIPNTVVCEEVVSIGGPINLEVSIDEQKLLDNGKKCLSLQQKAPTACKLLKKTTSRNYWKKTPFTFIQVNFFETFSFK